jgi:hypothetical protein
MTTKPTLLCGDKDGDIFPINRNGLRVAEAYSEKMQQHIVRAVNSHEELLSIVKTIAEQFNAGADKVYRDALSPHSDDVSLGEWINQAIAKAEGK